MTADKRTDKTVKLTLPTYTLVQRLAAAEDRKLRNVIDRALAYYAAKHAPQVLKEATP